MLLVWLVGGLFSGLLLNYLADVLPLTRRLSQPNWWPFSWQAFAAYLLKPRVVLVSIFSGVAAAGLLLFPPQDFPVWSLVLILAFFLLVTVIDIEHRLVLHPISIAGAALMGLIGFDRHGLLNTLLGGVAGFGSMLALYFIGDWVGRFLAKVRKEKWEETALGFGDVNLSGIIGILMGWPGVLVALFAGMLAAALFSAGHLLISIVRRKYSAFATIPYAPFLCLGAVLLILISVYRT